jgi:chaperonin GroES
MNIKPLGERILVEHMETPDKSEGGVIIPDVAQERPNEGIILALGTGVYDPTTGERHRNEDFHVGDHVVYSKYAGSEIKDDSGKLVLLISERDIMAIRVPEPEPALELSER